MKYYRNGNFIFWVGEGKQFYFFVGKGKTRVGGSVNHGIKNLSPNIGKILSVLDIKN